MTDTVYVFCWGWPRFVADWRDRKATGRKGQRCRVLVRGGRNSALVEFEDGYRAVTSRNALRCFKPEAR